MYLREHIRRTHCRYPMAQRALGGLPHTGNDVATGSLVGIRSLPAAPLAVPVVTGMPMGAFFLESTHHRNPTPGGTTYSPTDPPQGYKKSQNVDQKSFFVVCVKHIAFAIAGRWNWVPASNDWCPPTPPWCCPRDFLQSFTAKPSSDLSHSTPHLRTLGFDVFLVSKKGGVKRKMLAGPSLSLGVGQTCSQLQWTAVNSCSWP